MVSVSIAGAAGAVARYLLGAAVQRLLGGRFPWGTTVVNLAGTVLLGWVVAGSGPAPPVLTVGFLGGFTTYSTWMVESVILTEEGRRGLALGNLLGMTLAGLGGAALGLWMG
jgi:CrcB protein